MATAANGDLLSAVRSGSPNTDSRFGYNDGGQRTARVVNTVSGTTATFKNATVYAGGTELTLSGTTLTGTRRYGIGGAIVAVRVGNASPTYLFDDAQGSNSISVPSSGYTAATVTRQRYTPYGALRGQTSLTLPTQHGWLDQTSDPDTGLTYLNARYYDPAIGRFLAPDPLIAPDNPAALNPYTYANDNPVTLQDPSGLSAVLPGEGGGGGGGGGGTADQDRNSGCRSLDCQSSGSGGGNKGGRGSSGRAKHGPSSGASSSTAPSESTDSPTSRPWTTEDLIRRQAAEYQCMGCTPQFIPYCSGASGTPEGCDAYYAYQEAMGRAYLGAITGYDDFVGCTHGDKSSCAWTVVNLIPFTKALKLGKTASEAALIGEAASVAADACRLMSFSAKTTVLMADGTKKRIDQVEVGDKVLASDPVTGDEAPKSVLEVWVHEDTLTELRLADGSAISTTEDHPYWSIDDARFEPADALATGERVLGANGRPVIVVGWNAASSHTSLAFNLTVADLHTYHVGDDGILVHNTNCISSVIGGDSFLTKAAESAGRSQVVQAEMDGMFSKLAQGNMNPGVDTKSLTGTGIYYARGRRGARLFFRNVDGGVQIVAKADKNNETAVINYLKKLYGS